MKVTPWEVSGTVDYDELIKEFGIQKLDEKLLKRLEKYGKHYFLTRKIFFAHRDLNWILDEYEKGNKFYLYTGRGPSGDVHLGHLLPLMFTKWLQDVFDVELWFQITDDEKFLFKEGLEQEEAKRLAYENALDVIAVGFNPKKTHIFIDTDYSKTLYNNALRVAKKLNGTTVKAVFGLTDQSNVGQFFYTAIQSVPAFLPSVQAGKNIPCLIPHAFDQDPHFRITRDILPKLGYYKPASIQCRFLPPLQGVDGKMSASDKNTAIFLSDSPKEIRNKIMKYAFSGGQATVEEHRKKGGNPDIDVSYQWLTYFEEDDKKLKQIHDDYKSGKLLSGELKQILVDKIVKIVADHQQKREKAKKEIDKYLVKD